MKRDPLFAGWHMDKPYRKLRWRYVGITETTVETEVAREERFWLRLPLPIFGVLARAR